MCLILLSSVPRLPAVAAYWAHRRPNQLHPHSTISNLLWAQPLFAAFSCSLKLSATLPYRFWISSSDPVAVFDPPEYPYSVLDSF